MDSTKLKEFKDLIFTTNQLNGSSKMPTYLVIRGESVKFTNSLSLHAISNLDYLIVIGEKRWNIDFYVNWSSTIIGFFDRNLDIIDYIPLMNGVKVREIKFTTYKGTYYNEHKPILIVENLEGERIELMTEVNGWDNEFESLFTEANSDIKNLK